MSAPTMPTLLHSFLDWEGKTPGAIFLTQPVGGGHVEDHHWRAVGDQARRFAAYLHLLDLPPASNIAILGKNSAHWIIADIAIMMAGHVSVPLYTTLNGASARYILDHAEARLLILGKLDGSNDNWPEIEQHLPAGLPLVSLPMSPRRDIAQWDVIVADHLPLQAVNDPVPGDLCTIVYTSGSTGTPKGVMHSYGSMIAVQEPLRQHSNVVPTDRILCYLPLAHVAERMSEGLALYNGLHVFFSESLATFPDDLRRARPTIFFSVPRLWVKFRQGVDTRLSPRRQRLLFTLPGIAHLARRRVLAGLGLDHVRIAVTGSAPLSVDMIAWYRGLGLELLDGYGMSENFGMSHFTRLGHSVPGQVGTVIDGVDAYVDENGELLVRSPGQMLGYYRDPALTAEVMTPDGYMRTGDRGAVDARGGLVLSGRVKDNFKTARGKFVAPIPIENKLNHAALEVACVSGAGRRQPFALLLLTPEAKAKVADPAAHAMLKAVLRDLVRDVNAGLASHERLSHAVMIRDKWTPENGLLTPTLKIVRHQIDATYNGREYTHVENDVIALPA